jgi:outer membrane protein OmpA-like peptidoglycan-associated protein
MSISFLEKEFRVRRVVFWILNFGFASHKKLIIVFFLVITMLNQLEGQLQPYSISKAPFSSDKFDDFSPVYFSSGIVFSSNRFVESNFDYTGPRNAGFFNILYADTSSNSATMKVKLFSKSLTTILNDGPVSFNRTGDTIYYSRNLEVDPKAKNLSGPRNKLGIFIAHLEDGEWSKIREFRLNNETFNITTPCLSPEGNTLYFASDKPGGSGGLDLYYSRRKEGFWTDPVNLGEVINTSGNESFPYITSSGDLLFSSDGHPGLGGKDIFVTRLVDSVWLEPIPISSPVNSEYDDFGIVSDDRIGEGYFSSNRDGSFDIFRFKASIPPVFYTSIQKENQYCYIFFDNSSLAFDTTILSYRWNFGGGKFSVDMPAKNCFDGPGKYFVTLDIVDKRTGSPFFTTLSYNFEIRDFEQPFIACPDVTVIGEAVEIDGSKSNLPGYEIIDYTWSFGDGHRSTGQRTSHSYSKAGEYYINLEVSMRSLITGEKSRSGVSKKILVVTSNMTRDEYKSQVAAKTSSASEISDLENIGSLKKYLAVSDINGDAVFAVEIFKSTNKVPLSSGNFRNIPSKYSISERFNYEDNTYRYYVDKQMTLMATYPAYREMRTLGMNNTRVVVYKLTDPLEIELYHLAKTNGVSADLYFDNMGKLTPNAYLILEEIFKLLNKYPFGRIEVAVHTDNIGPEDSNQFLTQTRAQLIVNYLINRGISATRLAAKGYGESRPVAPNFVLKDRKLNQRVEFIAF